MTEVLIAFTVVVIAIVLGFVYVFKMFIAQLKVEKIMEKSDTPTEAQLFKDVFEPQPVPVEEPVIDNNFIPLLDGNQIVQLENERRIQENN